MTDATRRTSPGTQPGIAWHRVALPWILTGVAVAVATVATALLEELLVRSIFLLLLLTILLSAWWGGRPTALLAVALSGVASAWLLPPVGSFLITSRADVVRLGAFVVAATVMALLTGSLRAARSDS